MAASLETGGWRAELEQLLDRFGRLFVRAEPRQQAGRYLEGLLGPVKRKNGWQLAEHLGEPGPQGVQRHAPVGLPDAEGAGDRRRNEVRVAEGGELDEPGPPPRPPTSLSPSRGG